MKRDIDAISNTRSSASYRFSAEEYSTEKEKILAEYCTSVAVPGFRKGKAPKSIISSRFADDIESRTRSVLINKAFDDLEKSKTELNVLAVVDFSADKEGDEFVCKLVYDLQPTIELPDYRSIKLDGFSIEVSDDEVEKEFDRLKRQNAQYVTVDRAVQAGDYVKVDYEGTFDDGSKIADVVPDHKIWGLQHSTWEEAGNADVPGVQSVIQGIIGHKVGDTGEVKQTFPEDFSVPALAGKQANYTFKVLDVRERINPVIDEKFLKQYGVDTEHELKENIKKSIAQHKNTQGLVKQRDQIVDFLADSAKFELPDSVFKHETQTLMKMFIDSQIRNGVPVKQLEKVVENMSAGMAPMANRRGKSGLMLDKIADQEKISIENKDIEAMIWQDSMLRRQDVNHYVNELKKSRELLLDLRTRALRGKVLDFLMRINSKEAKMVEQPAPEETEQNN